MEQEPMPLLSKLGSLLEGKRGAMALNVLIAAMMVLALLLPPVSAQERILESGYTSIDRDEGGSVVDPGDSMQVTLLPDGLLSDVKLREDAVPMRTFLDGMAGKDLYSAAEALQSDTIQVKSPIYRMALKGTMPTSVSVRVPIPNNSEPYETVSLYEWTGERWAFLPGTVVIEDDGSEWIEGHNLDHVPGAVAVFQCDGRPGQVSGELPDYVGLPEPGRQALAELNPVGYYLGDENSIQGTLATLPESTGQESYRVMPSLRNWTEDGMVRSDLVDNMLIMTESRNAHVRTIVDLVTNEMYAGIDLDYRGIDADLQGELSAFVQQLAEELHARGKRLSLHAEMPVQIAEDRWDTGAFDWQALGQVVDALKFPALMDPAAYAPGGQMEALLLWAVGRVERYKLQPEFTARSVELAGGVLVESTYRDALAKLSSLSLREGDQEPLVPGDQVTVSLDTMGVEQDPATGQYRFSYRDQASGQQRTVWLEDASSLSSKLALVERFHLGGIAMRALWDEGNDPRLWNLVHEYQASAGQAVSAVQSSFSLRWTIENAAAGQVWEESSGIQDSDYTWTAPSEPGTYQLSAEVVANDGQTVAGGERLAFVVEEPTPTPTPTFTPTPLPTSTPTPSPTFTPTPTPTSVPPTRTPTSRPSNPQPTNTPRPSAPNPNFGYGIQAHMVDNGQEGAAMGKIKDMGFGWVKQQVEWKHHEQAKGAYNWGSLDAIAGAATGAGVKVLWSVVKAPAWARGGQDLSVEGPPNNPADFADFLGALATRYCGTSVKAIEVWNEQNLHYEWGNKPINAAEYMNLLKPAYNRIKQVCPSMIVVSGALTPTGAPPPLAKDDLSYLEAMYANGLKNFSDAIGAHPSGYNVSPAVMGGQDACDFITQQGSSFRGPCNTLHRSWSFRATMTRYREVMVANGDSAKKIWPTEFGWASGWTGAPGYEYANDNTLQEQAQWTVAAYQQMKQWGWVGVPFLWNLNFRVVAPGSEQAQWGIVWGDWTPTPAYTALKNMAK